MLEFGATSDGRPRRIKQRGAVELDVDHGRREMRQQLGKRSTPDDRIAKRLSEFGSGAKHQWHASQKCRYRDHEDRPQAQLASLVNRLLGA